MFEGIISKKIPKYFQNILEHLTSYLQDLPNEIKSVICILKHRLQATKGDTNGTVLLSQ